MKQQKDNWVKILFSFAAPCKGKMALSVFCAILSVAGGFIPFWAVYEILLAFINQNVTLNGILIWCLVGAVGYLLRVACHGISTIMAHISAYTILEGIRLKIADRLMKAPLGEVMGRRIGLIPKKELFSGYRVGDEVRVRVTRVRGDGKLDLTTRDKAGSQIFSDSDLVMKVIEEFDGVLPFNDKASPEVIAREFKLSKNAFKRAVGHLLKEGKIEITEKSIRKIDK